MAPDTVFRIASQTKAITSVAISLVEEEDRTQRSGLQLHSPFVPRWRSGNHCRPNDKSPSGPATHAGSPTAPAHCPGMKRNRPCRRPDGLGRQDQATRDDGAALSLPSPWPVTPGSTAATPTSSAAVVRVQMPLMSSCAHHRAARVRDTRFFLPAAERDRLAAVYASGPAGQIVRAPEGAKGQGAYVDGPKRSFAGGAGLLSTARDYARFLEMIRNGGTSGSIRILAPRTVELMTTNQVGTLHSANGLGFGFGFETTDRYGANGLDSRGAFGWGGAYGTLYRVDPEARLVLVLMIQLLPNATDIREKFPTLVYQSLVEPPSKSN